MSENNNNNENKNTEDFEQKAVTYEYKILMQQKYTQRLLKIIIALLVVLIVLKCYFLG